MNGGIEKMYKLFLHPTEKPSEERKTKAAPLLEKYLVESPRIQKEFYLNQYIGNLAKDVKKDDNYAVVNVNPYSSYLEFVSDKENPDLLVKIINPSYKPTKEIEKWIQWVDHCAFEFKFGMDLVNSLNSQTLRDELTRMKRKYHYDEWPSGTECNLPLYLVIVNEWPDKGTQPFISNKDQARASTIAQDLNIRFKYCDHPSTFAKNVFDLIRTPPKEVDLGQRFVIKSSGSIFNQQLQKQPGITAGCANAIEEIYDCWPRLVYEELEGYWSMETHKREWRRKFNETFDPLKTAFTTDSGRFMKANMEKFLKKVSGK